MPGILPGIAFRVVATGRSRMGKTEFVEGRTPFPGRILAAHQLGGRVKEVQVIERTVGKEDTVFPVAQLAGQQGGTIIVIAAFQRTGDGFHGNQVIGIIPVLIVHRPVGFLVIFRQRFADGRIGSLRIYSLNAFQAGLDQHGDCVIANHGVGFPAPERPDGQISLGPALFDQATDKVVHIVRDKQGVKRMGRPIGVP